LSGRFRNRILEPYDGGGGRVARLGQPSDARRQSRRRSRSGLPLPLSQGRLPAPSRAVRRPAVEFDAASLAGIAPHDRARQAAQVGGCATLLLRQGRSILEVAKILGHVDASMVMRVYGHVATDTLRDAMASLNGFARRAS
jgi:integrase